MDSQAGWPISSAFLARDQSTATDFESRLVGRVLRARFERALRALPALPGIAAISKLVARSEIAAKLDRAASARGI